MDNYILAHEYEKNVNPNMNTVPIYSKNINDLELGISFIDFSNIFNVDHKATTPNLLASFIKLNINENIELSNNLDKSKDFNATSHLFFIIQGNTELIIDGVTYSANLGDILITPCFSHVNIKNSGINEAQIYYINDSSLINYLGSSATKKTFQTAVYSKDFLITNLHKLSNPNNNRKGILLSNKDTEKFGNNTITPVLWALYNELPPNTVQRPHKHNSVALDLCVKCDDSENVYTLVGEKLDENGNIVDPVKVHWKTSEMFITPPSLWHSHHNDGDTYAYILPIQDAGILLYQRILGIVLN
jgi:gentisate 1,2-dioxygenase